MTPACDIFAVGVCIAEMLTRVQPWRGFRPVMVCVQVVLYKQRPSLPPDDERCPPRLRKLVESMWQVG